MPEGDSIRTVAEQLRPRLEGQPLRDVRTRGDAPLTALIGQSLVAIEAHGKHLLLRSEAGPSLRVHLGMHGRWRRFEPGVRWRRPRKLASLILATDAHVFACFKAQVEVVRGAQPERAPALARLGPDLLDPQVDLDAILARAYADLRRPVHEALLDQRIAAGIGNVYKSELLFLSGLPPSLPMAQVTRPVLRELYALATRLLRANVGAVRRVTRGVEPGEPPRHPGEPRYYVYRRTGQPCFRCATPIRHARSGEFARATFWCPSCQPAAE